MKINSVSPIRWVAAAALVPILWLSACNLIEDLIKIPIRIHTEITVPIGTGVGILVEFDSDEVETNLEEELELNDSRIDRVKTATLREAVITVVSPSGSDLSFLNDIEVFLTDDELGDLKIAWRNDIPDDIGGELTLNVDGADLTDYLKKQTLHLESRITTDEVLLSNYTLDIFTRFRVTADIF